MKRLFIAINLPENIKRQIEAIIKNSPVYYDDNIRFIEPKNRHLTLCFLGSQPEETIKLILKSIKETAGNSGLLIEFEKMIFAPVNKPARMIWLLGSRETSQILTRVKNELENNLIKNSVKFKRENRGFNGHLTLARFKTGKIKTSEIKLPQIEKLSFTAKSLDLMESRLKRNGAEYEILS